MPFSSEERKCPHCGGYESWDMMVHLNGDFYCQDCYIKMMEAKETHEEHEVFV